MTRQQQYSCTVVTNTAGIFPIADGQQLLSCTTVNMESGDLLKDLADNIWFVLGAYFFAFFPWSLMHNIDFISEKWRTCSRTRTLARIHLASSIFPIIYVAVYAEAQRRAEENTEFAAALAALTFNVFQLLRTIMGIVQLNAFVAWCKDARECLRALSGIDEGGNGNDRDSRAEGMKRFCGFLNVEIFVTWWKLGMGRMREYMGGNTENSADESIAGEEDIESSLDTYLINEYHGEDEDIEEKIEVNNTVIDNELGGREVTVLPSWEKLWGGLKKGSLAPSKWLHTDRVMLSTVRWCGSYLCGMGEHWSLGEDVDREDAEILEKFFSRDMSSMRYSLQLVEWNIDMGHGGPELMSIYQLHAREQRELDGEMCTAYGTAFDWYSVSFTWSVESYAFEFNSLVSSYPANDWEEIVAGNREIVRVGLAHSLVLAKHLGVDKLKAIRQYYDNYCVPFGSIRGNAFRLLAKQTDCSIPDDARTWQMFESIVYEIPLFPYRMQAVALWDEATNWRVLQASAQQDIMNSLYDEVDLQLDNEEELLYNAPREVDIFEHCTEWSEKHALEKGSLGIVIETVRTFLAEWLAESEGEPNWEPEVPKNSFEFGPIQSIYDIPFREEVEQPLVWVCQRELQNKIAKMGDKDENFPGNAALIMLFLLGFPVLRIEVLHDSEVGSKENQQERLETSTASSLNRDNSVDVSVGECRVWTVLAPQDISLMLRVDFTNRTVSLRLRNDSGITEFRWQDWVDAAMGCLKGIEENDDGDLGYGRQILKADVRKPMVELSPLCVNEDGMEPEVEKTDTARVWMGWPPFDVRICKFELDQWFNACNVKLNGGLERKERSTAEDEVSRFEEMMIRVISEENAEVETSTQGDED